MNKSFEQKFEQHFWMEAVNKTEIVNKTCEWNLWTKFGKKSFLKSWIKGVNKIVNKIWEQKYEEKLWTSSITQVLNRSCKHLVCYLNIICEQKLWEKVGQKLWAKLWTKDVNKSYEPYH